jgi:hypothetical protein
MAEQDGPGLRLPEKEFGFFDGAIREAYGMSIGEIAETQEPMFAFLAIHTGLTALFSREKYNKLVQKIETPDGTQTTAVTGRNMDGETAFTGSVEHAMYGVMDGVLAKYESSEADFVISVVRTPGLLRKLRGQRSTIEVVAVIPHNPDEQF